MSRKKNKGNRPPSKRRHDESATNRYRQVTALIPIDRNNEPIPVARKELAKAMLEVTGSKTTSIEQSIQPPEPKQPSNVVSLCKRRQAANEVEHSTSPAAQAIINHDRSVYQKWSSERNKENVKRWAEFSLFHRREYNGHVLEGEADLTEHRRLQSFDNSHPKGRNYLNDDGTYQHKPISTVHNPGISATPIEHGGYVDGKAKTVKYSNTIASLNQRNRDRIVGLAPSGRPISEFTEGTFTPLREHKSTEVRQSAAPSKPKKAVNNAPRAWTAEEQLRMMFSIVPEEHWPMDHIKPYVFQNDNGQWHVHTGKVRNAVSAGEDRGISRAVALAFIEHSKDQQEQLIALEADQAGLLSQFNHLEFLYTHTIGEELDWTPQGARKSVREMDKAKYATSYAKPPGIDQLVAEFKNFNSFVQFNGASEAFARFHYGDPLIAKRVEDECQRRIEQRALDAQPKLQMLRLRAFLREVPLLIKLTQERAFMQKLSSKFSSVARETYALRMMHKRNHAVRPSYKAYLSGFIIHQTDRFCSDSKITMNGQRVLTDVVEVRCTKPAMFWPQPVINYRRVIAKAVGCRPWPQYVEVSPTVRLLSNDKGTPVQYDTARMRRWEKWLEGCEQRDVERQQASEEQAIADARQWAEDRKRAVMQKPINRAINKVSQALQTAWQFGNRDVFITKEEQRKREENIRILRERTENEIREQNKHDEEERRAEAEQEARRERNRQVKARRKDKKRAAEAAHEEQKAAKAAAREAFRKVH